LVWPVVNVVALLGVLTQLTRTVRKMATVGWPGFHVEGPSFLADQKLGSLLVPAMNLFGERADFFGEAVLPMGLPGAVLPLTTALLYARLVTQTTRRLTETFLPLDADGKPKQMIELDKSKLAQMAYIDRAALFIPMAAGLGSATLSFLTVPLLFTTLTSPQAVCYALAPSLLMTMGISEAREIPAVHRFVLGKKFADELARDTTTTAGGR
jgi:hypothetical protein